jgi:hypothetical protein
MNTAAVTLAPAVLPLAPCAASVDARLYAERYTDLARDVLRAAGNLGGAHTQRHEDELATLADQYAAIAARYEALAAELAAAERAA